MSILMVEIELAMLDGIVHGMMSDLISSLDGLVYRQVRIVEIYLS